MGVQRLVLICPAEVLPDEASEKVPDPECEQSDEREYPDEASQEYLTEDYTEVIIAKDS